MGLQLPPIQVIAENLPEGWEKSVLACWEWGATIATQYDKPGDPPSRDVSLFLTVADPFAEPRIHRAMPGGFDDLEVYRQEVVDGIHDHWICPEEGKWQYSYHERIAAYTVPGLPEPVDQIDYVVSALCEAPHTRRAQAVLWKAWDDKDCDHPACLQRLWFRIFNDRLLMEASMRSNDGYKAAFMNMYAFTDLQRYVAERISEGLGREIKVGQYNHHVSSFHIYGSYFEDFKGFLKTVVSRSWEERTYRTEDVQILIDEARKKIAKALAKEKDEKFGPVCVVYDKDGTLVEQMADKRMHELIRDLCIIVEEYEFAAEVKRQDDGSVEIWSKPWDTDIVMHRDKPHLYYRIVPKEAS